MIVIVGKIMSNSIVAIEFGKLRGIVEGVTIRLWKASDKCLVDVKRREGFVLLFALWLQ